MQSVWFGLPEPNAPEDFEVWPDNWPAVEMFCVARRNGAQRLQAFAVLTM